MNLRSSLLPSLLSAALVVGAACGSDDPAEALGFPDSPLVTVTTDSLELEVEIRTSPQPPKKGLAAVQLVVTETEGGAPAQGMAIEVAPWMSSMGHGSNEVAAIERSPGVYEASGLLFSMPGPWELMLVFTGSREDAALTSSFDVEP